jgi:hypothetical protein
MKHLNNFEDTGKINETGVVATMDDIKGNVGLSTNELIHLISDFGKLKNIRAHNANELEFEFMAGAVLINMKKKTVEAFGTE